MVHGSSKCDIAFCFDVFIIFTNMFIHQRNIKLLKSDVKDICNVKKGFIFYFWLEELFFYKNMK